MRALCLLYGLVFADDNAGKSENIDRRDASPQQHLCNGLNGRSGCIDVVNQHNGASPQPFQGAGVERKSSLHVPRPAIAAKADLLPRLAVALDEAPFHAQP